MSLVTPIQSSFNGGEISRRLTARIDQGLYAISCLEMVGFAPLVEGPAEAMPGLIHVAQAPGQVRLFRFEYNTTQGHVIEASDGLFRVYTNDALVAVDGAALEINSPYDDEAVQLLKTHQSYDVLYCFHPDMAPREFYRTDATTFGFDFLAMENGPFESRNKDTSLRVSASAFSGNIILAATAPLFAATDVGGLFQIEAEDFGDTPAWEPGITVTAGALRTSLERVYRCISEGRTGSLQPSHTEGVEWDGMGSGKDINDKDAPGVQWEYLHDKYGIMRITGFTNSQSVAATVLRRLPFSTVSGNYAYDGGYYNAGFGVFAAPGVAYSYGTWRWRFGAFSDTRGWPVGGCIWNERLCLFKESTVYGSVSGDFTDFATVNEFGELSNDMAFVATIQDPNPIVEVAADDKLLVFTAAGCYALGPASAAQGVGPKNLRLDKQHDASTNRVDSVAMDGRTLTVSRCGTRIYETDFDPGRGVESAIDLTRYARHIGAAHFVALAQQRHPHNHIWALRSDGVLVCFNYLPEEQVLGGARRETAEGVIVRSMVSSTDPDGHFQQIWVAAEFDGGWHVLRMAPWREDGESDDTGVMLDMAIADEANPPRSNFSAPLLAGRTVQVVADGRWSEVEAAAGTGAFELDQDAARIVVGLPYEAAIEQLPLEAGGNNGPARGKMARIARAWIEVIDARGLWFGAPGTDLQPIEQLQRDSETDEAFGPESGQRIIERAGDQTRQPRLRVERRAPFQATIAAICAHLDVQQS